MESTILVSCPPLLDRQNYSYRKVRVKTYIKAIHEKTWHAILTGWSLSNVTTADRMVVTFIPKETWSKDEIFFANINFKELNAIFADVYVTQFKLISACESSRDA